MKLRVNSHSNCTIDGCSRCLHEYQDWQKSRLLSTPHALPPPESQRRVIISLAWKDYGTRHKLRQACEAVSRPISRLSLRRGVREKSPEPSIAVEPPNLDGLFEVESPVAILELPGTELSHELPATYPSSSYPPSPAATSLSPPPYSALESPTSSSLSSSSPLEHTLDTQASAFHYSEPEDLMALWEGTEYHSGVNPPVYSFIESGFGSDISSPTLDVLALQSSSAEQFGSWNEPGVSASAFNNPAGPSQGVTTRASSSFAEHQEPQMQSEWQPPTVAGPSESTSNHGWGPVALATPSLAAGIVLQRLKNAFMSRSNHMLHERAMYPFSGMNESGPSPRPALEELAHGFKTFLQDSIGGPSSVSWVLNQLAYPMLDCITGHRLIEHAFGYGQASNRSSGSANYVDPTEPPASNLVGQLQKRVSWILESSPIDNQFVGELIKSGLFVVLFFVSVIGNILDSEQFSHLGCPRLQCSHPHCVFLPADVLLTNVWSDFNWAEFLPFQNAVKLAWEAMPSGDTYNLAVMKSNIIFYATEELHKFSPSIDGEALFIRFISTLIDICDSVSWDWTFHQALGQQRYGHQGLQDCIKGLELLVKGAEPTFGGLYGANAQSSQSYRTQVPAAFPSFGTSAMEPSSSQSTMMSGFSPNVSPRLGSSTETSPASSPGTVPQTEFDVQVTHCSLCPWWIGTVEVSQNKKISQAVRDHFIEEHADRFDDRHPELGSVSKNDSLKIRAIIETERRERGLSTAPRIKWLSFCPSCLSTFGTGKPSEDDTTHLKDARDRVGRHLRTTKKCPGGVKTQKWFCRFCPKRFNRIDMQKKHEKDVHRRLQQYEG